MKPITPTLLFCIAVCLSACNVETVHVDEYHGGHYNDRSQSSFPELNSFHIIDSYEHSTEFDEGTPTVISPYRNRGMFELSWGMTWVEDGYHTQHNHPYRIEFIVNDRPQLDGGIVVSTDWCGPAEDCGRYSYQNCYFYEELTMSCDYPESSRSKKAQDISELFPAIPAQLYFFVEVCDEDLFYCEYKSRRVILE